MREQTIREVAKLLGKRGGDTTLKRYGKAAMKEWGQRGAAYGKRGGRPKGSRNKVKRG